MIKKEKRERIQTNLLGSRVVSLRSQKEKIGHGDRTSTIPFSRHEMLLAKSDTDRRSLHNKKRTIRYMFVFVDRYFL